VGFAAKNDEMLK